MMRQALYNCIFRKARRVIIRVIGAVLSKYHISLQSIETYSFKDINNLSIYSYFSMYCCADYRKICEIFQITLNRHSSIFC